MSGMTISGYSQGEYPALRKIFAQIAQKQAATRTTNTSSNPMERMACSASYRRVPIRSRGQ